MYIIMFAYKGCKNNFSEWPYPFLGLFEISNPLSEKLINQLM